MTRSELWYKVSRIIHNTARLSHDAMVDEIVALVDAYEPPRPVVCKPAQGDRPPAIPHCEERHARIYQKFHVERVDGSSAPGGKHERCQYFVLDWRHDKFAVPAARAYADACAEEYPELADNLRAMANAFGEAQPAQGEGAPLVHSAVAVNEKVEIIPQLPGSLSVVWCDGHVRAVEMAKALTAARMPAQKGGETP